MTTSGTTPGTTRAASFDVLAPERCFDLLAVTTVGRVAFVGSCGLQVLPVNYRVVDGLVMVRTSTRGTLAELAGYAGEVLLEADYHSTVSREGWSVIVRATSAAVGDDHSPELLPLVPWVTGEHHLLLALRPHQITGRRVSWVLDDKTAGHG